MGTAGICLVLSAVVGFVPAAASTQLPGRAHPAMRKPSPPAVKKPKGPNAPASSECNPSKGYRGTIGESWAQKRLGLERVWPLTRGQGVTVGLIDSGVEPDHPMLTGQVSRLVDLSGANTGGRDCNGHGTGVAALIAGRDMSDRKIPLSGVAPQSRLYVIKHQNGDSDQEGGARLPNAIREAVAGNAKVINISISTGDSPALAEAVTFAQRRDVVIVAAAGNVRKTDGADGPAFPAGYPGVISVASLGPEGDRAETSGPRSKVDVAAPGKDVVTAWTRGGYNLQAQGTSFATAYVSGVAALVRSRRPDLDQRQVVHRILSTADGNVGEGTGQGMVNPLQAVTAVLPGEGATASPAQAGPARFAGSPETDHRTRTVAVSVAGGALSAAILAALAGVVVPLGRRRAWRPGRASHQIGTGEDDATVSTRSGPIGLRPHRGGTE
ncbi:S8 family serine peptidase [Actinomadura syzygii]|nr:S8 family serine peptidase [Actinomadura syzygii]